MRARRPHRGPVVAVLPDGARSAGAFRREPYADLARPRRRAGTWQEDGSGEGEEGAFGRLLLLERRTAPAPERTTAGRDGRNPAGVRRSRGRVLHDSFGRERERANGRCLLSRRPEDMGILDGNDDRGRAELIAERLRLWKLITTA